MWFIKDNDWIVPGYQYNEYIKKLQCPIHNFQTHAKTLNNNIKTEDKFYIYGVYEKFNDIPAEVNMELPIKSYNNQYRENL